MTTRNGAGTTAKPDQFETGQEGQFADLSSIIQPVAGEMALVEEWLVTNLIDDSPFVGDLLAQIFQAGGKRIRPLISLLGSKASLTDSKDDAAHSEMSRLHSPSEFLKNIK